LHDEIDSRADSSAVTSQDGWQQSATDPVHNHRLLCRDPLPYPTSAATRENQRDGRILLHNYAGSVSELTASMQYIYGAHCLHDSNPELASLLECISITEMRHLKLLALSLVSLGIDPKYRTIASGRESWWSPRPPTVSYSANPQMIVLENIDGERKAIDQYIRSIDMIEDGNVNALLRRIIMDEEVHIKLLSQALQTLC
jgi:bacterioferritin